MEKIGSMTVIVLISSILIYSKLKGVPIFSVFISGAEKGLRTAVGILPVLVTIMSAVVVFRSSGAAEFIAKLCCPLTESVGIEPEILLLSLLKPISGSGANAAVMDIFAKYGPDSIAGVMASVIAASTETSLYVISVYTGRLGFKRLKCTVPLALLGDAVSIVTGICLCSLLFGGK